MEEDVEINILLQFNEKMLVEAVSAEKNKIEDNLKEISDHSNKNELTQEDNPKCTRNSNALQPDKCNENETNIICENSKQPPEQTAKGIKSKGNSSVSLQRNYTNVIYNDEIQELLDDQIVLCKLEKQPKPFYSDEETNSNEDTSDDNEEIECTIKQMFEDDSKKRSKSLDQPRKHVRNNNIQATEDLAHAQSLIVERQLILMNLEKEIQAELLVNIEKQRQLKKLIDTINNPDSSKIRQPSYTRCFFKKFGMPYFEDCNGFHPPRNEDYNRKIERGELIITSVPKVNYWIKTEKEMFLEAVKQTLIKENSERFIKEINKYNKILDTLTTQIDKDEVHKKIEESQEKLASLRCKSYSDLISQEDPNREYDWMRFSATVFNGSHSPEECRRYWNVYLKPTINRDKWKETEDAKLLETAELMQYQDWDSIANLLGTNRTAYQCLVRYQTHLYPENSYSGGKWTQKEDIKLLTLINSSKIGDFIPWSKITSYMKGRTHTQIYNRWSNCLNPKLVKGRFTKEEDLLIVSGIEIFGSTYKELASLIKNRSCSQIRERYERYLIPKTGKVGTWALEEDEKLLKLVEKHGDQNWAKISKEMKTRSRTQVRQRYNFIQYSMSSKSDWNIKQIKRKKLNNVSKGLQRTRRNVKMLKEKVEKAEKAFKLSKLESDTFRFERLKELRDNIFKKRFENKRRKKIMLINSEVNCQLINYFKNYSQSAVPVISYPPDKYNNIYLNEVILMGKYFGHDIVLPESENEILNNPRLGKRLQDFLCKTRCYVQSFNASIANLDEKSPPTNLTSISENNINYVNPSVDNTMLMKEWWHTPPIDITSLNFSEMFKRTVFDYSYGMHADIWKSKINRSSEAPCFGKSSEEISEDQLKTSKTGMLKTHATPNALTVLGLRSLYLYRLRLLRKATGKGLHGTLNYENNLMQNDFVVDFKVLDKFQETMLTLFSWPRVLGLTDIRSTSIFPTNHCRYLQNPKKKRLQIKVLNEFIKDVNPASNKLPKNDDPEQWRFRESMSAQSEDHKYQLLQEKKGLTYKRKIEIEGKQKCDNLVKRRRGRPRKFVPLNTDQIQVNTFLRSGLADNNCQPTTSHQCSCEIGKEISMCGVCKKSKMKLEKDKNMCPVDSCDYKSDLKHSIHSTVTYRKSKKMCKRALSTNELSDRVNKKLKSKSETSTAMPETCLEIVINEV